MPNFRPMFIFANGERVGNAQVFATRQEANDSAVARCMVWTQPAGFGVDETDDLVNYVRLSKRGDVSLRALELEPDP
jgi:hypothetical protein